MSLVSDNYEFIYVDVGKQRNVSEAGVLVWTSFYDQLKRDKFNFPTNEENGENLNSLIIDDEAFALHEHILKPYSKKERTNKKCYLMTD
jgi:hypothetical protein